MMTFSIRNLKITAVGADASRICYILYPFDGLHDWIEGAAVEYGVSIAVVTGIDWDNALTPWKAKGVPAGSPDFAGEAPEFLRLLREEVMPQTERRLGIEPDAERTLAGDSLSGLFTLWQWLGCDLFDNIISLSGSFWYEGFVEWVKSVSIPQKKGRAYFLLGNREALARVPQFRSVQTDTVEIVKYLAAHGISDFFELVPGNHYQNAIPRLDRAFGWMFGGQSKTPSNEASSALLSEST